MRELACHHSAFPRHGRFTLFRELQRVAGAVSVLPLFLVLWVSGGFFGSNAASADGCTTAGLPDQALAQHVRVSIHREAPPARGRIRASKSAPIRTGSGIILGSRGIIITAAHVARSTRRSAYITGRDGARLAYDIAYVDAENETAVLAPREAAHADFREFSVNRQPQAGERVVGLGVSRDGFTCERGTILAGRVDRTFRFGAFSFRDPILVRMRGAAGFSGGPLLDMNGRLIGMIVGYSLTETAAGERKAGGEVYVLPVERLSRKVEAYTDR